MTHPFDWQCQPEADQWLHLLVQEFKSKNKAIAQLQEQLSSKTSTRLFDWIDHLTIDSSASALQALEKCGFEQESAQLHYRVFAHPGAKFPRLLVREDTAKHPIGIAIKVESIADFLMVHRLQRCIEGSPLSPYRRCLISKEGEVALLCVERRASRSMEPVYQSDSALDDYLTLLERLQSRCRDSFLELSALVEEGISLVGKDTAAWIFFEVERKYWQMRNLAAQLQKARQDSVGMGWANHDHHTFRSSRKNFSQLIRIFEMLGFHCRERFYAGAQAGWGAQIMENPICDLVVFNDVDLDPSELDIDFAHQPLGDLSTLNTVGLWCALHGDSILEAGMHHLEAQFAFDKLKEDLSDQNIEMMQPFSHFPYLKQAFTKGEIWAVDPTRVETLLKQKLISSTDAEKFVTQGALGSHLENLQRDEGYKGFNKESVNIIMKRTDPRHPISK